jgi:hypothetical protein
MKGNFKYWMLLLLLTATVAGCKPEEIVLDPPPSKLDGINGTFTLAEVVQIDPFVIGGGNSLDVTSVYTSGAAPSITFVASDHTFTFDPGDGPDYLGSAGTWAFDNDDYPTLISMDNGTATYDLPLLHTIRPQDEFLQFEFARSCGGTVTVKYQFKFARN